jgi:serine kinase of HPr protein (carbohydrate metabolism regulator)
VDDSAFATTTLLHASCVALQGRGLLILGASGSGKSSLSLQLMAYGCALVADDAVAVSRDNGLLVADCPPSIRGRIEARGLGLLAAEPAGAVRLAAVVDLDRIETQRLPPERTLTLLGVAVPLILNSPRLLFAPALLQYLKGSRCA